jgi:amidophosphoribosyltransferase
VSLHESCGIFGVYAPGEDVARLTFFALFALQHRGQESSGIATTSGHGVFLYTGMGLVSHVFDEAALSRLPGVIAIGHNRYSTAGSSRLANAQPIVVDGSDGKLALAHNGNIINAVPLRQELEEKGYRFATTSDSEVIASLIASSPGTTLEEKISHTMRRLQGAYSLVILDDNRLIGVRDPMGVRPLCLGKVDNGWVLASETCALDHIGSSFIREVNPGEIITIDSNGPRGSQAIAPQIQALCVFEYIYFARPDSTIGGRLLYRTREGMGRGLAQEYPVDADLVVGVPDSATVAAIAYSKESGIPFGEGLLKNRYVGRTFINPDQRIRELGVGLKFNPLREIIAGKRLVLVDDSIVRGTTTPRVINLLKKAGAKEVHMRVCAPPISYPCFFGVDMATRWELIAARKTVPEIKEFINADSLGYLSLEGLIKAVALPKDSLCLACLTGDYPIPVQLEMDKLALEALPTEGVHFR